LPSSSFGHLFKDCKFCSAKDAYHKNKSRIQMSFFLESMVREGKRKISKIKWIIFVKRDGYKALRGSPPSF